MYAAVAIVIGILYAAALYLMLRRSLVKLLLGLSMLGHASNLLLFTSAGLTRQRPPLLSSEHSAYADPLIQALVLTAIVINFSVLAFAVALVHRAHEASGSDDVYELEAP